MGHLVVGRGSVGNGTFYPPSGQLVKLHCMELWNLVSQIVNNFKTKVRFSDADDRDGSRKFWWGVNAIIVYGT